MQTALPNFVTIADMARFTGTTAGTMRVIVQQAQLSYVGNKTYRMVDVLSLYTLYGMNDEALEALLLAQFNGEKVCLSAAAVTKLLSLDKNRITALDVPHFSFGIGARPRVFFPISSLVCVFEPFENAMQKTAAELLEGTIKGTYRLISQNKMKQLLAQDGVSLDLLEETGLVVHTIVPLKDRVRPRRHYLITV